MAFNRPTLEQINARVKADIKNTLNILAILRRSFLNAFATAIAGAAHLLHGHLSQISLDVLSVSFWAKTIFGLSENPATFTQLSLKFTGTPGAVIPVSTGVKRTDGTEYTTDAEGTIQTAVTGVAEETDITCVADSGGSLNNTYFLYSTPLVDYYFWFNVSGAGTDPNIGGRAGVMIAIASGETADNVAAALQAAMDGESDITATVLSDVVTAINDDDGSVDDAIEGGQATGFTFNTTTQGVTEVIGGEVNITVTADDAGSETNTDAADTLTLVSAITNVDSTATVVATVTEGEDAETTENFELRASDIIQNPPLGGSVNDYEQVALAVPGVTRAWVYPNYLAAGNVGVTFVQDDEPGIIPGAAKIAEVLAAIEDFKPVTANVFVFAPVAVPINPTIKISPNNSTIQQAIKDELNDLLLRDANPKGAFKIPGETYTGTILKSRIDEAISIAQGEEDHLIVSPAADFTLSTDVEIATLGTVTWQAL